MVCVCVRFPFLFTRSIVVATCHRPPPRREKTTVVFLPMPGVNVDFASLSFHVPICGLAQKPEVVAVTHKATAIISVRVFIAVGRLSPLIIMRGVILISWCFLFSRFLMQRSSSRTQASCEDEQHRSKRFDKCEHRTRLHLPKSMIYQSQLVRILVDRSLSQETLCLS